ncbi:hypothetical protein Tco_0843916 [Tanacetum coccineum]
MASRGGRNNLVARRVIDDLIDISGQRLPLKYLKIFIEQQIIDHRRFIARMRDEIRTSTNLISQLNALITELEASSDYEDVFDLVMELQDNKRDEQDKVADFNRLIAVAEEKIHGKEIDLEMLEAEGNDAFALVCEASMCLIRIVVGNAVSGFWQVYSEVLLHRLNFGRINWFSDYMDEYNHNGNYGYMAPSPEGVASPHNQVRIMETQAIDDQDPLVNYDNDNENDDLGYQSEEYFDEVQEDDENNHSNGNVVKRGITRLYKFRREYGKPDGIKLSVTFDALNRISGKHRALFSSFLGDMVREHIGLKILSWKKVDSEARDKLWDEITRYFDVDLTVRKLVMNRLGQLLRNFRRKLRQTYILPNQNTLSKLNEVPTKYSAILKAEEWVNFVKYTTTKEYQVKSTVAKMAHSKSIYQHRMGQGRYIHIKNKEIEPDEEPPCGIMWFKGRVNKDGQFPNDEIRSVGDKLKETEDKIKEGTFKVDHGTDAMTVVLGKEREVMQEEWEVELHTRVGCTKGQLQSMSTQLTPSDFILHVSPVDINPIDSSADEEGGTPLSVVGCENDASIQKSNGLATSEKEMETRWTISNPLNSSADERANILLLDVFFRMNARIRKENSKKETVNLWDSKKTTNLSERIFQVNIPNPKKMCRTLHHIPADYVSAGHVLVSADRDRIC